MPAPYVIIGPGGNPLLSASGLLRVTDTSPAPADCCCGNCGYCTSSPRRHAAVTFAGVPGGTCGCAVNGIEYELTQNESECIWGDGTTQSAGFSFVCGAETIFLSLVLTLGTDGMGNFIATVNLDLFSIPSFFSAEANYQSTQPALFDCGAETEIGPIPLFSTSGSFPLCGFLDPGATVSIRFY